jgi:predicted RNA-binding protein with PIN domain
MHYLIDGYNLLHVLGLMHDPMGPTGLERARLRLLELLNGAYAAEEHGRVTVVFDAAGAPRGVPEVREYRGIHVRFAVKFPEADDLIEEIIAHDSAPRQLSVVSDDHRIQAAARHRHCVVVGCDNYLEWLSCHRRERLRPAQAPGKPQKLSDAETQSWLKEFADLENDPELKEFFEMYDFGSEDPDSAV